MILTLIIIIDFLFAGYFLFFRKNNIHKLEIFVYWCFAIILFQNMSAILYLQFKVIILSELKSYNWADTLNRLILLPLMVVWLLDLYNSFEKKEKVLLPFIFLNILCGIEWASDWLGLFKHHNWKFWWSYVLNVVILLLSLGFMKIYRGYFYRKGRSNEVYIRLE